MGLEPYICPLDEETGSVLTAYLMTDVENAEEVRTAAGDACAAVNARLVLHPLQLAVAVNSAALAARRHALRTRTLPAELLYNLAPCNSITQSLQAMGVNSDTPDLLLCFVSSRDTLADHDSVLRVARGIHRPLADLATVTDVPGLRHLYKLPDSMPEADLLDTVLTRMATKGFA